MQKKLYFSKSKHPLHKHKLKETFRLWYFILRAEGKEQNYIQEIHK